VKPPCYPPPMKISIKSPTLDLDVEGVKSLKDVLEFVREFKEIEAGSARAEDEKPPKQKKA